MGRSQQGEDWLAFDRRQIPSIEADLAEGGVQIWVVGGGGEHSWSLGRGALVTLCCREPGSLQGDEV